MAKLPHAPDLERLRALEPSLVRLPAAAVLHRVYRRGGPFPTLWNDFRRYGPTAARFDHHLPDERGRGRVQERAIVYAATDIPTAIAEVFQQRRAIDRALDAPWLVSAELARELVLLDLTDTFALRAGGSMKLVSGPTVYAQAWSRGFHEAYPDVQGVRYPSSLTNRPVVALYERALALGDGPFAPPPPFHRALTDALPLEPLRNVAREIGYDLS